MKKRMMMLGLMTLCGVGGMPGDGTLPWEDSDSRTLQQEKIVREMQLAGIVINGGPLDLASNNSLGRMNEYVAVWYKPKDSGIFADFCLFGQDEKLLQDITYNRTTFAISEKLNKEKILKNSFAFNTPDKVRGLARKLYNGEAMPEAYLCVINKTNMVMDDKFLCLHPHGFFFFFESYLRKPSAYWTITQDFHKEANSFSNITLRTEIRSIREDAARREIEAARREAVLKELVIVLHKKVEDTQKEVVEVGQKAQLVMNTLMHQLEAQQQKTEKLNEMLISMLARGAAQIESLMPADYERSVEPTPSAASSSWDLT